LYDFIDLIDFEATIFTVASSSSSCCHPAGRARLDWIFSFFDLF
jgi:hypothetical protein